MKNNMFYNERYLRLYSKGLFMFQYFPRVLGEWCIDIDIYGLVSA